MEDIRPYSTEMEETLRLPREDRPMIEREAAPNEDELPFEIPRD